MLNFNPAKSGNSFAIMGLNGVQTGSTLQHFNPAKSGNSFAIHKFVQALTHYDGLISIQLNLETLLQFPKPKITKANPKINNFNPAKSGNSFAIFQIRNKVPCACMLYFNPAKSGNSFAMELWNFIMRYYPPKFQSS